MKALPVHYFLNMLWCVGIRKPYHQRTREKAGFLGDTDPVKLTITVTSNHRLLEVLKGQNPGLLESAAELSPEETQAQNESGLCLLSSKVLPYPKLHQLVCRVGWDVRHLGLPENSF